MRVCTKLKDCRKVSSDTFIKQLSKIEGVKKSTVICFCSTYSHSSFGFRKKSDGMMAKVQPERIGIKK